MGGGLMQLVAYGAQDIYLTGNPQITFFKVVYRRHTNFSMEAIQQTFSGTVGFGNKVTATISRNGDLISKMYCRISAGVGTASTGSAANVTHALLEEVELEIGGQRIDKHYNHWLETWAQLTQKNDIGAHPAYLNGGAQGAALDQSTIGAAATASTLFQRMSLSGGCGQDGAAVLDQFSDAYVPLQFWFCRNPGLALPLIALQYHEVKVAITLASSGTNATSVVANAASLDTFELWVDYIYLDTDERRRFAQQSHEYLIEQVQHQQYAASSTSMDLNFNHPVKELIWTGVGSVAVAAANTANMGPAVPSTLNGSTFLLKLNGHDRFAARDLMYFTRTQVHQHHSGHGGINVKDSIAVYSFALKPEEHQPSGTCNFSRIDDARLIPGTAQGASGTHVYAVNYNVLRIMSGMGGLAYSN